ncbi:uncharacterized protein TRIADDRAFT_53882 [Trichoplax adhaerens]|uniref:Uncharacterized protein n=1 Tax=Trichoplax adhaerens TaxID=10228 RepID=B3RQF0_TRIAD|nr:hypothetical protein TRIADDRAFT_53882 [Trichoplax adhaerens]EDV27818.1 hypothetical protein TRIADDRAFT_53882 [Trichoplax adhaerens]|eukprot:XP_002109652.1 hypothetical protein TRIADDRAFT_53882 [Trichoplax adhaerens]
MYQNIHMVVSGNENSYKDRLRLIQTLVKSNNGQDRDIKGDRKHYKKLLTTEGKAHMLLIRIEDSNPNEELSRWMDTLIYVYNTRDRHGLTKLIEYINQIHTYLNQSNTANEQNHPSIPVVLIGIIDSLETSSSSSPHSTRIIDEISIKKIIDEISQCSHYEVKATSTQQVEKLLIDGYISR